MVTWPWATAPYEPVAKSIGIGGAARACVARSAKAAPIVMVIVVVRTKLVCLIIAISIVVVAVDASMSAQPTLSSFQRAAAASSAALASTQAAPEGFSTCFQNGARVFR